jgi:3-carboxy-cis,cis-muconate cycloisomerase
MSADKGAAGTDSGLLAPVWAGTDAAELACDEAWLQAMLDVEVALARAQAGLGLIPGTAVDPIAAAARAEHIDLPALAVQARGAANPVVRLVQMLTAAVTERDPGAAEYVHYGGTSQDILDTAAMLVAARVLDRIGVDLSRTAAALADLARRHRLTPMAGRTLTQHAVPITFGLKAAGWLTLVLDAVDRVRRLTDGGLYAQLGGAAGTLASYLEYARVVRGANTEVDHSALTARFAAEVGLAEPVLPWHAVRTPLADLAAVLTFVTGAVGKFALDVQGMSRTEVAEVAEPVAEDRGVSSAMPQKRNPVLATLVMSAARQVPGYATVLSQCMLAEDERSAGGWHAEWQPLRECLRLAGGAVGTAAELAEGLLVFPERLRANLDLSGGTIVSERLNVALAPMLGKAAAKKLLARLALRSADDGTSFADLLRDAPELTGALDAEALHALADPEGYLGASAALVDRVLLRYRTWAEPVG